MDALVDARIHVLRDLSSSSFFYFLFLYICLSFVSIKTMRKMNRLSRETILLVLIFELLLWKLI